jgi:hypothetical protein
MKKNTIKLPTTTKYLIDSGEFIEVNSIFFSFPDAANHLE